MPASCTTPQVEPICRKYLELRYRMLPYLYSAVRECATTGHAGDARALAALSRRSEGGGLRRPVSLGKESAGRAGGGDGRTSRQVYLPHGDWYDFWTGERMAGGREISRAVDLETMPLYVRAGSILPLGPVKQYTARARTAAFDFDLSRSRCFLLTV